MSLLFDRVTIVGAGLLGASLGLALQATGAARHVVGVGRRQESLDTALRVGAITEGSLDLATAVSQSDLIVIATPAGTVIPTIDQVRIACPEGAIVIDVASTKAAICIHAENTWPTPRRFIGCHPMAGSEKSGPENAIATLYNNSVCLIETHNDIDPDALARVRQLWEAVGAHTLAIDPATHDTILAQTSHVPHILSTILATTAAECEATQAFVGNGFRDMTRIAAGNPEMWRDITQTNRAAIANGLVAVKDQLDLFLAALAAGDGSTLADLFEAGKAAREKVLSE